MDCEIAQQMLAQLHYELAQICRHDPDQEIRGIAIPVLDEVLTEARECVNNSIWDRLRDIISMESLRAGEPIRAVDGLVAVSVLASAFPHRDARSSP